MPKEKNLLKARRQNNLSQNKKGNTRKETHKLIPGLTNKGLGRF